MIAETHGIIVKLGMRALLEMDREELAAFAGTHGAWLTKRHIINVLENPHWKNPEEEDRFLKLVESLQSAKSTCEGGAAASA